ncbi:hypothetical protein ACFVJ3_44230 [Rhodococcus sp. NPDC127593]|uniref:hypothetical protein n=1 Tax=Rhodococcus sp. NPDC127593 TaxID=3345404 RepID=UPI00363ED2D3
MTGSVGQHRGGESLELLTGCGVRVGGDVGRGLSLGQAGGGGQPPRRDTPGVSDCLNLQIGRSV